MPEKAPCRFLNSASGRCLRFDTLDDFFELDGLLEQEKSGQVNHEYVGKVCTVIVWPPDKSDSGKILVSHRTCRVYNEPANQFNCTGYLGTDYRFGPNSEAGSEILRLHCPALFSAV